MSIRENLGMREHKPATYSEAVGRWLGVKLGRALWAVIRLIWSFKLTLIFALVAVSLFRVQPVLGVVFVVVLLAPAIAAYWVDNPVLRVWRSVVLHDFVAFAAARRDKKALLAGNDYIFSQCLVSDKEQIYPVYAYVDDVARKVVLRCNINDLPVTADQFTAWCEQSKMYWAAALVHIDMTPSGDFTVTYFERDPLAVGWEIKQIGDVPLDWGNYSFAGLVDETGENVPLSFKNVSGVLIGGNAGSGKSLSILSNLVPYVVEGRKLGHVDLAVLIDGKSGGDLTPLAPLSQSGLIVETSSEIQFLTDARDALKSLQDEMNRRYEMMRSAGEQNLWDNPDFPQKLAIIDECQSLLETPPTGAQFKEHRELVSEIQALVRSLLKRGRAAKISVVLMTQKTDASAIPTNIRDITQLRVGFSVANVENSRMIFGYIDDDPRAFYPHKIGKNPGVASVFVEGKNPYPVRVRFGYATMATLKNMVGGE